MYSAFSSATHHIFFPPRLQVVAFEQDPDCLPTDAGNQFALDGLLDHQAHRPTCAAFRRITAHHRDDALLLGIVENLLGPGPLLVIQGAIQAATAVTVSDLADSLRGERQRLRDSGRGSAPGELSESQGAQDDAYLLNAGSQELLEAGAVLRLDLDGDWASRHTP